MIFNRSIIEIIKERTSWRTFSPDPIQESLKKDFTLFLKLNNNQSPFNKYSRNYRFTTISIPDFDPNEQKKLGTYGFIQGAQEFIVGAIEKSEYDLENYGYLMELLILKATDLGLGTCWLGGFFNKSLFSEKINCNSHETVPAISPLGYPIKRRTKEKIIRTIIKAKKRRSWDQIFFKNDFATPLMNTELGEFSILLEMVRIGPSAGNKQPWRIVKEGDKKIFHFYIAPQLGKIGQIYKRFTRLDIGIAVCHFDLCAKELGLEGNWDFLNPNIKGSEEYSYTISWFSS